MKAEKIWRKKFYVFGRGLSVYCLSEGQYGIVYVSFKCMNIFYPVIPHLGIYPKGIIKFKRMWMQKLLTLGKNQEQSKMVITGGLVE